MPRSYLINLLVEVHVDLSSKGDWDTLKRQLSDEYWWKVSHGLLAEKGTRPSLISATIESWAEEGIDGGYDHTQYVEAEDLV